MYKAGQNMSRSDTEKIDIFSHISPPKYDKALWQKAKFTVIKEINASVPALVDLDKRFHSMDQFEGLKQVLTIVQPPMESVVEAGDAVELARLANDEMAELVVKYPDRFAAAAGCLPMNDVDAALREADRVIRELNFKGVQIYTPVNGKPLDSPEFMELYKMMSGFDLPIWIHPTGEPSVPDYPNEDQSKYDLYASIGWPYQTTLGMARLVFSGIFDKYPNLKFIVHHLGAMVPFFAPRLGRPRAWLKKPPEEYFKMFYVDTALHGYIPSLLCSYSFFGAEHILFGTDAPFAGEESIRKNLKAIESIDLSDDSKTRIISGNTKSLLHLPT
jgi:predicted TIM-barrel fold metal-dependent hydrolase